MSATRRKGLFVTSVLAMLTLGTVTAASAHWAGLGGGSDSAGTGTAQTVVLGPATASAELFPGGRAAVALTVTNPNQGSLRVGSLALDTSQGSAGFSVDGAHAGCGLSTLAYATQTNGGAGWSFPPGPVTLSVPSALSMDLGAANACQGASFTVYLKAGP